MLVGGGVGSSLHTWLLKQDRIFNALEYRIATCTLHALNLTLSVPIKQILGKSGLHNQTML